MIRFHAASSGTTNTLNYFFDIWITSQDLYILLIVYDWWSHTFILCFFFVFTFLSGVFLVSAISE